MTDDRDSVAASLARRPALDALLGVVARRLIRAVADRQALQPNLLPRLVHHGEHVGEAPVLLAHEVADRAVPVAERHHGGRAGMDAKLVLDRGAGHVVARTQRAVGVDQELGYEEQRNPPRAFRRIGQTGEHQVHDVGGHIVVAPGDEDFLAEQPVVVAVRHRLAADRGQIGPRLRLGQVHGTGPFTADQVRQVAVLQLIRGVRVDRFHCPGGQQRTQGEGHVRRVPHLHRRGRHEIGQPLAAAFGIAREGIPAIVHKLAVGRGKSLRRDHAILRPGCALLVAGLVEGREHLAGQFRRFPQHGLHQVGRDLFEAGDCGEALEVSQFVDHELHVAHRRTIGRHGMSPRKSWRCRSGSPDAFPSCQYPREHDRGL